MAFQKWMSLLLLGILGLFMWSNHSILGLPMNTSYFVPHKSNQAYEYGYRAGDHFKFTDTTIEILNTSESYLEREITDNYEVWIDTIEENTANYFIRITARIASLTYGLLNFTNTKIMEGYSPILAGPSVVFTHTNWGAHLSDWQTSLEDYMAQTHMRGTAEQNPDTHYFNWNLSRYVDAFGSIYDTDQDGENDGYQTIHRYTALFDEQGVVLLREFYIEHKFDNESHFTRIHRITLVREVTTPTTIFSPEFLILLGAIVSALIVAVFTTLFLKRRSEPSPQRTTNQC